MLRQTLRALLMLGLSSCTLVTGAGEYEVDPVREQQEIDEDLMSRVRDLDYTMLKMSDNHPGLPMDVAIVDLDHVMQARARIMLAPQPTGAESRIELVHLDNALVEGPQTLYFYVDSDQDYLVDGTADRFVEHIWIKPVNPDGTGEFTHSTTFQFFDETAFGTQTDGVVLKFPGPDLIGMLTPAQKDCVRRQVDELFQETFEAKVYLTNEERQVGLFKTYKGGTLPADNRVNLKGILDNGNDYTIQCVADGVVLREVVGIVAPDTGDLVLEPRQWLPDDFPLLACFM